MVTKFFHTSSPHPWMTNNTVHLLLFCDEISNKTGPPRPHPHQWLLLSYPIKKMAKKVFLYQSLPPVSDDTQSSTLRWIWSPRCSHPPLVEELSIWRVQYLRDMYCWVLKYKLVRKKRCYWHPWVSESECSENCWVFKCKFFGEKKLCGVILTPLSQWIWTLRKTKRYHWHCWVTFDHWPDC